MYNRIKEVALLFVVATSVSMFSAGEAVYAGQMSPYAYAKITNEDNIFRAPINEQDDTISHLGAGLNEDFRIKQHSLLLNVLVDSAWYQTFDQLNHTKVDGRGTLLWEASRRWSGDISYGYNRRLSSFDEQLVRQKDMRTMHDIFASGNYKLSTDWQVGGRLDYTDVFYEERNFLDTDVAGGQVEALYRNARGSHVGMRLRYTDHNLQDLTFNNSQIDNDFTETTLGGLVHWEKTSKSILDASLGITSVSFNEIDSRDYDGWVGRLTYYWVPTGNTLFDMSAWQEVSTLDREVSGYVLSKGFSFRPVWSVTSKLKLDGLVMYSNDDFRGANLLEQIVTSAPREDDVWTYLLGVAWMPKDHLRVKFDYRHRDRVSSINLRDFTVNQYNAELRIGF